MAAPPTRSAVERSLVDRLGAPAEARWMVESVLGRGSSMATVDAGQLDRLRAMADRRVGGEPLQYVLGAWAFRTLELAVDPRALIPRPETEQVVEVALAELKGERPAVVDLGTGSGAVALSVAVERPDAEVWATDVDLAALALATENAARTGAAVAFRQGSWYDALPGELRGRVDLVVANPPYVSEDEWPGLDPEVRREPRRALVAGEGSDGTPGLAAVEAVVRGASGWLAPGGAVVVELAPHQAGAAMRAARAAGLVRVRVAPDLAGRDRMVVARAPGGLGGHSQGRGWGPRPLEEPGVGAPGGPGGHSQGRGWGPRPLEEPGVGAPGGPERQ